MGPNKKDYSIWVHVGVPYFWETTNCRVQVLLTLFCIVFGVMAVSSIVQHLASKERLGYCGGFRV